MKRTDVINLADKDMLALSIIPQAISANVEHLLLSFFPFCPQEATTGVNVCFACYTFLLYFVIQAAAIVQNGYLESSSIFFALL